MYTREGQNNIVQKDNYDSFKFCHKIPAKKRHHDETPVYNFVDIFENNDTKTTSNLSSGGNESNIATLQSASLISEDVDTGALSPTPITASSQKITLMIPKPPPSPNSLPEKQLLEQEVFNKMDEFFPGASNKADAKIDGSVIPDVEAIKEINNGLL